MGKHELVRLCPECQGTGRKYSQLTTTCERCDGYGTVARYLTDEELRNDPA